MSRRLSFLLLIAATLGVAALPAQSRKDDDPLLRALSAEMERSKSLRFASLEAPYYIEYAVDDSESYSISASLGGVVTARNNRIRYPRIQVRVGTPGLDNTNFILTDYFTSGHSPMPTDNRILPLRQYLWLATDAAFKASSEAFARKRAALANFVNTERLEDFSAAKSVVKLLPVPARKIDEPQWTARVRSLSSVFAGYPQVLSSVVEFETGRSTAYLVNSEGTEVRMPDNLSYLRIRASAQAPDGSTVRDTALFQVADIERMPGEAELRAAAVALGESVSALAKAPAGENYSGPVVFEGTSAAQLFAEVLGRNLAPVRRPVSIPGRPMPVLESELEGRMGARVLPEWMDVLDDPTQTEWHGKPLLGHYPVDLEGVVPAPLKVVEKGTLAGFLLTRQPVRGYSASNGRARLPGNFGAKAAMISNLFVTASNTVPSAELKKRLIEMVVKRNKPYGLLVRKIDFPSSASGDELRSISASIAESGSSRAVSVPILVYKVYPDGREELVRGLRFKGLSVRSLKDIAAASTESYLFDFVNNTAPFALIGGASYVTGSTVVAPAVLFEDLDFERPQEELPKLPIVPPPPLMASN